MVIEPKRASFCFNRFQTVSRSKDSNILAFHCQNVDHIACLFFYVLLPEDRVFFEKKKTISKWLVTANPFP